MVKDVDIASYVDDSTAFIMENNIDSVIASLEQVSDALFNWFKNNHKCRAFVFFLSGFSFMNIHDSQDNRGRGRLFL